MMIIIIRPTALSGTLPLQANVASDLYPGHPPSNFYNPVSFRFSLPSQSILISVGHVLVDLQVLYTMSEDSRRQCLILLCSVSLAADRCVFLRVIAEVSVQLHFLKACNSNFYGVELLVSRPNTNMEGQNINFFRGQHP
jgi:hypothetical protein